MFDKAKAIIKEDACMKFYDETKLLYIEPDVFGVGLGVDLLQTRSNTSYPLMKCQTIAYSDPLHSPVRA